MGELHASVVSVNISRGGIPKLPIPVGQVTVDGIAGDGHNHPKHIGPHVAISLLDLEDLEDLKREGYAVSPGACGENVTVTGIDTDALKPGDRLAFSGGVEIEVTKLRKPCYVLDAIDPQLKKTIVGRCGALAKVLVTGEIRAGETIELVRAASLSTV